MHVHLDRDVHAVRLSLTAHVAAGDVLDVCLRRVGRELEVNRLILPAAVEELLHDARHLRLYVRHRLAKHLAKEVAVAGGRHARGPRGRSDWICAAGARTGSARRARAARTARAPACHGAGTRVAAGRVTAHGTGAAGATRRSLARTRAAREET